MALQCSLRLKSREESSSLSQVESSTVMHSSSTLTRISNHIQPQQTIIIVGSIIDPSYPPLRGIPDPLKRCSTVVTAKMLRVFAYISVFQKMMQSYRMSLVIGRRLGLRLSTVSYAPMVWCPYSIHFYR